MDANKKDSQKSPFRDQQISNAKKLLMEHRNKLSLKKGKKQPTTSTEPDKPCVVLDLTSSPTTSQDQSQFDFKNLIDDPLFQTDTESDFSLKSKEDTQTGNLTMEKKTSKNVKHKRKFNCRNFVLTPAAVKSRSIRNKISLMEDTLLALQKDSDKTSNSKTMSTKNFLKLLDQQKETNSLIDTLIKNLQQQLKDFNERQTEAQIENEALKSQLTQLNGELLLMKADFNNLLRTSVTNEKELELLKLDRENGRKRQSTLILENDCLQEKLNNTLKDLEKEKLASEQKDNTFLQQLQNERQQTQTYYDQIIQNLLTEKETARQELTDLIQSNDKLIKHFNNTETFSTTPQLTKDLQYQWPKSTLVITPSDNAINMKELKTKISDLQPPKEIQITKFKYDNDNLELRCRDVQGKDNLKQFLTEHSELLKGTTIHEKKPSSIKIIFPNIHKNLGTDKILESLCMNFRISEDSITEVQRNPTFSNNNKDTLTLRLPSTIAKQLLVEGKLFVGLRPVKCFKFVRLYRCLNCHEYNTHDTRDCGNQTVCPFCGGFHSLDNCKSKRPSCGNCLYWNEECNKNKNYSELIENIDHKVTSSECPIYLLERKYRANKL